jgi:dUTP pyrophosphatase
MNGYKPFMTTAQISFKKLDERAMLPTRGTDQAAALDLYSIEDMIIPAQGFGSVHTGLAVAIPAGFYGRIAGRSGLAAKHGIDTLGGVIDRDYRGELICILANHSNSDFEVKAGDRVAQFVIEAIITPEPVFADELSETIRGEKGFGSTNL